MLTVEMLQKEASELESELAQIEPKRKRLVLLRELIQTYGSAGRVEPIGSTQNSSSRMRRFSGMGTTEGINRFLSERPTEYFSPREIAKGLIEGGLSSASPNFFNIVYTICKRKAETGHFQGIDRGGKRVFRAAQISMELS